MTIRNRILPTFGRYFSPAAAAYIHDLPVPESLTPVDGSIEMVALPDWAADLGVGSPPSLLLPSSCICGQGEASWQNVDWWRAAFLMMTCAAEQIHEREHGPLHGYAQRLPDSISPLWQRAWVNRILLFLRRWIAYRAEAAEDELFGARPRGIVHLTHDVDYVGKTLALRIKQSAFNQYNIARSLLSGRFKHAVSLVPRLLRFALGPGGYWQFPKIRELESSFGVTSAWNFYAGVGGFKRSASELLLDPAYRVADSKIAQQIKMLRETGHRIGLHQGYHSWRDSTRMATEKRRLEQALDGPVDSCRQHWLRFSFAETWKAQEAAGFRLDTTLGFNDLSGFRNGAALRMPAWIEGEQRFSATLDTLPMILMDSHLYDYGLLEANARRRVIDYYLDEIAFVGGEATVIWHQRVFHPDYGWGDDYRYLLAGMAARNLAA